MRYDFSETDETDDYTNLDQGWYTVGVEEVRESLTRDGAPRWGLKLVVCEGEFCGRIAAWDGLVWSERGASRAKRLLEAFGIDASGEVEIVPVDLIGRRADVELVPEEWENPDTGRRSRRNRVPYDGFARAGSVEERRRAETEGLPMVVH
jgi:hypothetical protein